MWSSWSVTCGKLVVLYEYSGFLHQNKWAPWYNWNIVESGVRHHIPNPQHIRGKNKWPYLLYEICCWTDELRHSTFLRFHVKWVNKCLYLCLTPLSTIFQLYHGAHLFWWRKPEYSYKTTNFPQVTDQLDHIMLYRVHLAMSGICPHNIIAGVDWGLIIYWLMRFNILHNLYLYSIYLDLSRYKGTGEGYQVSNPHCCSVYPQTVDRTFISPSTHQR
jgi:hypothetical protein